MTDQERLEYLGRVKNEAWQKVYDQEKLITEKLYNILAELNKGGVPLRPLGSQETVRLEPYGDYGDKEVKWKLQKNIEFSAWSEKDIKDGRRYDFGSDFYLYITSKKISINHGTCGTWDKTEKGQLSRLYLMARIFENENRIISELNEIINPQIIRDYYQASADYNNLENKIKSDQRKKEEEELLATIKPGMYFAYRGYHYEDSGKVYHWYSLEKIVKITDKNFITEEKYGYTHRRDKTSWLYRVKAKHIFLINGPDDPCPAPEGE